MKRIARFRIHVVEIICRLCEFQLLHSACVMNHRLYNNIDNVMAYANIKYMCSNMVSNLSANLQERYVHTYVLIRDRTTLSSNNFYWNNNHIRGNWRIVNRTEKRILVLINADPTYSVILISSESGIYKSRVWKILQKQIRIAYL